jgi:hypothetical protein
MATQDAARPRVDSPPPPPATPVVTSAPAAASAPGSTPPEAPLRTIEEAERALAEAEGQLLPHVSIDSDQPAGGTTPTEVEDKPARRGPSPCDTACRAFSSMTRAADAICRMTSDRDERCTSARKRVRSSAARIAHCGCPPASNHPPG